MGWVEWTAMIFGGLVVLDMLFVGTIVTIDIIREWRMSREYRRRRHQTH